MRHYLLSTAILLALIVGTGCNDHAAEPTAPPITASAGATAANPTNPQAEEPAVGEKLNLTDDEWKKRLTPEQYQVLRRHGTEPAFCGGYTAQKKFGVGIYHCSGCNAPLFTSDTKFESGSGWPSFFQPLPGRVDSETDTAYGMVRKEIHCARCGGHLGHVFEDGPQPTGLRYCINAVSLAFVPAAAPAAAKP